jgi:hypothetical protein
MTQWKRNQSKNGGVHPAVFFRLYKSHSKTIKEKRRPMSTPLRINEALLIAGHAFEPFQCVAWSLQDGNGELSMTVIDRTNTRIGRKQIPRSAYSDPAQLESLLEEARAELSQGGYKLQSWTMPK